ncbi:MAG TPA: hypothetical protein VGN32_01845, partial [Ktedonobacterales bacterium]|nr:hypothetical protein [Ktedonobacterales bacterium]
GLNLHRALDAMFALPTGQLLVEVRLACARLGHTPEQIHEQRSWPETALYRFLPHPALARRNMLLMNSVGVHATSNAMDRPGVRTARVSAAAQPLAAYADTPLVGYTAFTPLPYSKLPFYSNGIPPPALTGEEVSAPSLPT